MAERYGGKDFAINVKGLELPAYDPRGCVGQGLEYATTSRGGCHIRGSTMFLEATGPVSVDPLSPKAKPELVILQQNTNASVSSLSMCYFAAYAMIPDVIFNMDPNSLVYRILMKVMLNAGPAVHAVLKLPNPAQLLWFEKFLSHVLGRKISMGDLNTVGDRIMTLERLYNLREGLKPEVDDTLPARLLYEPTSRYPRGRAAREDAAAATTASAGGTGTASPPRRRSAAWRSGGSDAGPRPAHQAGRAAGGEDRSRRRRRPSGSCCARSSAASPRRSGPRRRSASSCSTAAASTWSRG